jgi:cell cycle sensor histidine kinase DivJ
MQAARDSAEAANRAKSAFLANMSHELRTPLNAIIGFADIMRDEMFGPLANERYREYISLIHSSGQLLLDLIGDVLDMAKIEAGKFELYREPVDLAATVRECAEFVAEKASRAGIALCVQVPPDSAICFADKRALKQIALNLVSNAVKFTPSGGRVDVAAAIDGGCARIVVRDTGVGIAVEDLPRLAQPFEQAGADVLLSKTGTGLGLALVRALAEKHGGRLSIESLPKLGTTVTVEIPFTAQDAAAVA